MININKGRKKTAARMAESAENVEKTVKIASVEGDSVIDGVVLDSGGEVVDVDVQKAIERAEQSVDDKNYGLVGRRKTPKGKRYPITVHLRESVYLRIELVREDMLLPLTSIVNKAVEEYLDRYYPQY